MDFNRIITEVYNNPSVVGFLKNLCGDEWDDIRQGVFEKILGYPDTVMLAHKENRVPQLVITCCKNYYYDVLAKRKMRIEYIDGENFTKNTKSRNSIFVEASFFYEYKRIEEPATNIDWAIDILFEGMDVDFDRLYSICDELDNKRRNAIVKAANELKDHKHPDHFRGLMVKSIFKAGGKIVSQSKQGRPQNAERLLSRQTGIPLKIIQQIKNEYFNTV